MPLAVGDELMFLEGTRVTTSTKGIPAYLYKKSKDNDIFVKPKMGAGERIIIEAGTKLKIVELACFREQSPDCGDAILESDTGRRYSLGCSFKKCTAAELNLVFKKVRCEKINIVPANAPADSSPTRTPIEI